MNHVEHRWIPLPGTGFARDAEGHVWAVGARRQRLGPATPDLLAALTALSTPDTGRPPRLPATLDGLYRGGWLGIEISCDGRPLLAEFPLGGVPLPMEVDAPREPGPARLSRFAVLRGDGDHLVMESPRARSTVRVASAAVLDAVIDPTSAALPEPVRAAVLDRLAAAGFLAEPAEETDFRLRQWGPHELWFHARSRWGGGASADPVGPSTWARGVFPALPSRHEPVPGESRIALTVPAEPASALGVLLDERVSVRAHDDTRPLALTVFGEFLHRCARVRRTMTYDDVEYTARPYPSGGTAYELEIYPVVRLVEGLAPGLYRYEPHDHELVALPGVDPAICDELLRQAAVTAMVAEPPQVLLLVAARFGRMLWRYEGMGYATTLKNVGALYQTMYLVATEMGLGPCALGNSDPRLLARAAGLDPLVEGAVGEFLLGSRPAAR